MSRYRVYSWNQLDLLIVILSVVGIALEEFRIGNIIPINPTIIRVMRVLRIARGTSNLWYQSRAIGADYVKVVEDKPVLTAAEM